MRSYRPVISRTTAALAAVVTTTLLPSPTAFAHGHEATSRQVAVATLATFDHSAHETPENLVVVPGGVIVSLAFASTVVVLDRGGRRRQSLVVETAGGFIAGLAIDRYRHAVAIAVSSPDGDVAGLYEASLKPLSGTSAAGSGTSAAAELGTPRRLAALPAGAFPNGLAFDPAGNLYAADSLLGTLWRVPAGARPSEPAQAWIRDARLDPGPAGLPGANGLKYRDGQLFVSNTGRHTLLAVPLRGAAARQVRLVRDDLQIDDFAFGSDGTLYAALNQADQVVRTPLLPQDGPVTVLVDSSDGAHNPSAVALLEQGTHGSDSKPGVRLYLTNAAFDGPTPSPSVEVARLLPR